MLQMHCDICGEIVYTYRDSNGKIWDNFTIRERRRRKPQIKTTSFYEHWWNELHICGRCRQRIAEYAKYNKFECADEEDNDERNDQQTQIRQ